MAFENARAIGSAVALAAGAVLLPGAAAAHPDHFSGGDFGIVHFLTDPFHVALGATAILAFLVVRRSLGRSRALRRRDR